MTAGEKGIQFFAMEFHAETDAMVVEAKTRAPGMTHKLLGTYIDILRLQLHGWTGPLDGHSSHYKARLEATLAVYEGEQTGRTEAGVPTA